MRTAAGAISLRPFIIDRRNLVRPPTSSVNRINRLDILFTSKYLYPGPLPLMNPCHIAVTPSPLPRFSFTQCLKRSR